MWSWDYVVSILPSLLKALKITVQATLGGFLLALIGGLILALLRRSPIRIVSLLTGWLADFIRMTPLLVQLVFLYRGVPLLFGTYLPPIYIGIIGLGLHYSTFLAEVYRAGIDGVPKGQWEAAKALNFTAVHKWTRIILPQAMPPMIPVMGNYLITMFKETPLLAAITVSEMLLVAKDMMATDYRAFEPITMVGLLFLLVSIPAAILIRMLERRLNRQNSL